MDRVLLRLNLEVLGLLVDDIVLDRFEEFENRLYTTNQVMNLTRIPQQECWLRHFVDSVLWHDLALDGQQVLDIGCGPGFPCWPLANVRPDLKVTGVDSSGKMLSFLRTQPLDNLIVVKARAEYWAVREEYDIVTGRALAPLPIQLEVSVAPCRVGGRVIPMRSLNDEETIQKFDASPFGLELVNIEKRLLPVVDAVRLFPVYLKTKVTPSRYPRMWAEIKKAYAIKDL